ncbi:MAG: hypothetical protein ACREGJ_01410 [Candidatus Saccharimonadales bacterium]
MEEQITPPQNTSNQPEHHSDGHAINKKRVALVVGIVFAIALAIGGIVFAVTRPIAG